MSDLRQAAQDALEALDFANPMSAGGMAKCALAKEALRAALAAPTKQKPLTDDQIRELGIEHSDAGGDIGGLKGWTRFARAIETELAKRWGVEIEDEQD